MYSFKEVLKQQPATIVTVLAQFFTVAVVLGWISWSSETLVAVEGFALSLLTLFYVKPFTVSKDAMNQLAADPSVSEIPDPEGLSNTSFFQSEPATIEGWGAMGGEDFGKAP